jgi:hypothetical protein
MKTALTIILIILAAALCGCCCCAVPTSNSYNGTTPYPVSTTPTPEPTGWALYKTWSDEKVKAEAEHVDWYDFVHNPDKYKDKLIVVRGGYMSGDDPDYFFDINPNMMQMDSDFSINPADSRPIADGDNDKWHFVDFKAWWSDDYGKDADETLWWGDELELYGVYTGEQTYHYEGSDRYEHIPVIHGCCTEWAPGYSRPS